MHTNRGDFQYRVNKIIFVIVFYTPLSKNEIPIDSKTIKASVQHSCLLKVGASLVPPRRAGRSFRGNESLAVRCSYLFLHCQSIYGFCWIFHFNNKLFVFFVFQVHNYTVLDICSIPKDFIAVLIKCPSCNY